MASCFPSSGGNHLSCSSQKILQVTILASEWGSSIGGLSTINGELAIQLAKWPEVQITLLTPRCSEEDEPAAHNHNIRIVKAERKPGFDELEWRSFPPDHLKIDVIVAHGIKLGRQAQVIRQSHNCKWFQVVHTDPEELGRFKSYQKSISTGEKKHKAEVELCEMADFVVGVGRKLSEAFRSYFRWCKKNQTILFITPGIFHEFVDIEHVANEGKRRIVLVYGRGDAEDFQLKGLDIAGSAVAELDNTYLIFVGAPEGKHKEIEERFAKCGIPKSRLRIRSFLDCRESLRKLFYEVDLVLMPSRTEGFGLTGLEALSAGVPVLVSSNSGFGEALSQIPFGSSFVMNSEDPKVWAEEIKKIWTRDRLQRLQEAKVLRTCYEGKYNWANQSKLLVDKMIGMCHDFSAAASSPSAVSATRQATQTVDFTSGKLHTGGLTEPLSMLNLTRRNDEWSPFEAQARKKGKAPFTVKQGSPTEDELQKLGDEIAEKWMQLGRHLRVKEPKLRDIDQTEKQLCEKGYKMLMAWKQENGFEATYQTLVVALQQQNVQRKDLAETICYQYEESGYESGSDPMHCESQAKTNTKLEDLQQQEETEIGSNALLQSFVQSTSVKSGPESGSDPLEYESQAETDGKLEHPQQQEEMKIGSNALSQSIIQSNSNESESFLVDESGALCKLEEIQAAASIVFAPNAVPTAIMFRCTLLDSTLELLPSGKNEELVSNVIQLSYSESSGSSFTGEFDETVTVALSHCAAKLMGYEVVIGELVDSNKREWKDLETTNVWENSDVEGYLLSRQTVPYAEARVTRCSTYAVICRLKSHTYSIDHTRNEKFVCKIQEYPDLQVTIPAEIRTEGNLQLTLKVQEIPEEWLEESGVVVGPVLHITCSNTIQLLEPAEITLPMSLRADEKQYAEFSIREIVVSANADDGTTGWKDITEELPRPVELNDGVVTFQVTHFTRFFSSRKERKRLRNKKRKSFRGQSHLHHLVDMTPIAAGFAACLCTADEFGRKFQLRFCCYPSHLEKRVKHEWFSTYSVLLYGSGSSKEKLYEDVEIAASLHMGLKPCNDASADDFTLRFNRSEKYESEAIVRKKPGIPTIKFIKKDGLKCLRTMTIVVTEKVLQNARGMSEVGDSSENIWMPSFHGGQTPPKRQKTIKDGVKEGCPSLDELLDLSQKLIKWKPLGRHLLDMDEPTITQINLENEELEEKAYQMLRHWKQKKHKKATYQALFSALCRIHREDLAEEFCRAGTT